MMPEPLEMLQLCEHMKWSVQMYIATLLHANDDNGTYNVFVHWILILD